MKKIREIKKKIRETNIPITMYYVAIFILIAKPVFAASAMIKFSSRINTIIYLLEFALLIPKAIFEDYDKKDYFVNVLFILVGIFACYICDAKNKIILSLVLIGLKNVDIKKIIKMSFLICIIFTIFQFLLFLVDHFKNGGTIFNIFYLDRSEHKNLILCDSPNNWSSIATMCVIHYLYLFSDANKKYKDTVILLIYTFIIYAIGQSRGSLIVSLFLSICPLLINTKAISKHYKLLKWLALLFMIVMTIYMQVANESSGLAMLINKALTGRLHLSSFAYNKIGIKLIADIDYVNSIEGICLDNLFVYQTYFFGLIYTLLILGICIYFGYIRKVGVRTSFVLIALSMWCIVEHEPSAILRSIAPLVCVWNFYNNQVYDQN